MTPDSKKWLKFRLAGIMAIFLILFVALLSRAFQLQVLSSEHLKNLAQRQHITTLQLHPERGMIFDRNGEKLAISVLADSVCADPGRIADPAATARHMAKILNIDAGALQERLSEPRHFVWIARRITAQQAEKVNAAGIEGVFMIKEPRRFYPSGPLAAHLIGFAGLDARGLEGLERRYDAELRSKPERLTWARDAKGKRLYIQVDRKEKKRDESLNLVLTIDSRIQHLVETHLAEAVIDKGAKGGVAVVMDPKTGEILALANEPRFNPNNIRGLTAEHWRNRAITDVFDPGSTFKPFLVAAALEERAVHPKDMIDCEQGAFRVGNRTIREANRKQFGELSVADVLKYSSNIGSVKIAQKIGRDTYHDYISRFGFGARTGVDLLGESVGILRPSQNWTEVDTAAISFGQGLSVTAIQLISAMSAIANNGMLMRPYVVKGFTDQDNRPVRMFAPEPVRQVISPATAQMVSQMMTEVVSGEEGTGRNAHLVNVSVAGKTGTSQKFDFSRGVYSSTKVRTSFIGFFPVDDPQVVMLVMLDEPQRDRWGGMAAAPVFKNISDQMLNRFRTSIRETPVFEPEQMPTIRLMATEPLFVEEDPLEDESIMPAFTGLTVREAMRRANARSIELQVSGSGWAVRQYPPEGTPLGAGRVCKVVFETKN